VAVCGLRRCRLVASLDRINKVVFTETAKEGGGAEGEVLVPGVDASASPSARDTVTGQSGSEEELWGGVWGRQFSIVRISRSKAGMCVRSHFSLSFVIPQMCLVFENTLSVHWEAAEVQGSAVGEVHSTTG
jgi:hypothetical protein